MGCSTMPQYTAISEHSLVKGTLASIREWLTSLPEGSHASHFHVQEDVEVRPTKETYGRKPSSAFAIFDLKSYSWKMFQQYLLPDILELLSVTWPKSGMTVNGHAYRCHELEGYCLDHGYSYWGSITASMEMDYRLGKKAVLNVNPKNGAASRLTYKMLKHHGLWPTAMGIEWLLGFPIFWTEFMGSEMRFAHSKLQQHLSSFRGDL